MPFIDKTEKTILYIILFGGILTLILLYNFRFDPDLMMIIGYMAGACIGFSAAFVIYDLLFGKNWPN